MNNIIIIPVRLASTRLPNKPLADILGKTMTHRVFLKAKESDIGDVLIACDGEEIANEAKKIDADYIITDANLPSGTDRIYAATQKLKKNYDIIINLQGDLPNVDPTILQKCTQLLIDNPNFDIATPVTKITDPKEMQDPNIVKADFNLKTKQANYFYRQAKPASDQNYYHHIGIYAYRKSALEKFVHLPQSKNEQEAKLEQLRALDNNLNIGIQIVDGNPLSVDTTEDLQEIIKEISK